MIIPPLVEIYVEIYNGQHEDFQQWWDDHNPYTMDRPLHTVFFPMKDFLIAFPAKSVIDSCSMLRTLEVLGSNVINSTTARMSK